jgi:hypothetical protein
MYLEKVVKPRASLSANPKQMAALLKKREPEMDMTKAQLVKELAKKKGSTTKFTLNGSVIYGTMT